MKAFLYYIPALALAMLFSTCKKEPEYPKAVTIHYTGVVLDGNRKPISGVKIEAGEYPNYYKYKTTQIAYSDSLGRFNMEFYDEYPWAGKGYGDWRYGYNANHLNFVRCTKKNYKLVAMHQPHIYTDTIIMSEHSFAKIILNPVKTPADGISINMQSQDTVIKYTANPYGQNNDWSKCKVENRRDTTLIMRAAGDYKINISGQIYPGGYCNTTSFNYTIKTLYTHKDTIVYSIDY